MRLQRLYVFHRFEKGRCIIVMLFVSLQAGPRPPNIPKINARNASRIKIESGLMKSKILVAILASSAAIVSALPPDVDWPAHGGVDNIRYSALTQINRNNVSKLKVAWTYDSHDAFKGSEMQSNPVVVDGVLYATTPTMKVVAVNAE